MAEFLAENDPSEAGYRSAISRTYYGVFHIARLRLNEPGRSGIHRRVARRLHSLDSEAGAALVRLRELRNAADYRLQPEPELADWRHNYETAKQLADTVLESLR